MVNKGNFNKKEVIDMKDMVCGRLTVVERNGSDKNGSAMWKCRCECGNMVSVQGTRLRKGLTNSCGCLHDDYLKNNISHKIHGLKDTRLFTVWTNMKARCYNENSPQYKDYGGRGINICNEWLEEFQKFYDWAIANGYDEDLTIDRIEVNGNYEPSNCRWATVKVQNNNQRSNHIIEYNGEKRNLKEWSEILNINYDTLRIRLGKRKWTVDRAFTTPTFNRGGKK